MGRHQQQQRGRGERPQYSLSDQDRRAIIQDGNVKLLVKRAEELGEELKKEGLKSSQIRSIFGTVRLIQSTWPLKATADQTQRAYRQLQLLKPRLAYQAERNRGVGPLRDILTAAIDDVGNDRGRFQNFFDFFEAILAYHVAAGGE